MGEALMGDKDDTLRCPHCSTPVKKPPLSAKSKTHRRVCRACKNQYVVRDEVEHRIQTAEPVPVKIGDLFRMTSESFDTEEVYMVTDYHLTHCQGWWVSGNNPDGVSDLPRCSTGCDSIELLSEREAAKVRAKVRRESTTRRKKKGTVRG